MSDSPVYVSLSNSLAVSKELLHKTYAQLVSLEADGKGADTHTYHLWELHHKSQYPAYKISVDGVTDLSDRNILEKNGALHYLTQNLVLYMVKVVNNQPIVVSWDELKKSLS